MTSLDDIRLQAYLSRIGHPMPSQPDLATLDSLIAAQLAQIPFENVDVLLQRPIGIGLDAVFDKLVTRMRGGYCFEQNTLLGAALRTLGYGVTPLAARVRWNVPDDVPTTQSHMLLRVEAAHHSYIVDVGFGGPTPYRAMALPQTEPADLSFPYRLSSVETTDAAFHVYDLEARSASAWLKLYRFDLSPQQAIDFEPRNWYTSTHPASLFRNALTLARSQGNTRLTLVNGDFAVRAADGSVQRQQLDTPAAIVDALENRFGLTLDPADRAQLALKLPALIEARRNG